MYYISIHHNRQSVQKRKVPGLLLLIFMIMPVYLVLTHYHIFIKYSFETEQKNGIYLRV